MDEKEKKTIDEDPNVYKVLAMLFEPIVAREYETMKTGVSELNNHSLTISGNAASNIANCVAHSSQK